MIVVTGIPASSQAALLDELSALGTDMLQAAARPTRSRRPCCRTTPTAWPPRIGPVTAAQRGRQHPRRRYAAPTAPTRRRRRADRARQPDRPARHDQRPGRRPDGFLNPATDRFPTVVLGSVAADPARLHRAATGRATPAGVIGDRWFTVDRHPGPDAAVARDRPLRRWSAGTAARRTCGFDGHPDRPLRPGREDAVEAVAAVLPATVYPELPGAGRGQPALRRARRQTRHREHLLRAVPRAGRGRAAGRRHRGGQHHGRLGAGTPRARSACAGRSAPTRGQIRGQFLTESVVLAGARRRGRHGARAARPPSATPPTQLAARLSAASRWPGRRRRGRRRAGRRLPVDRARRRADPDRGARHRLTTAARGPRKYPCVRRENLWPTY